VSSENGKKRRKPCGGKGQSRGRHRTIERDNVERAKTWSRKENCEEETGGKKTMGAYAVQKQTGILKKTKKGQRTKGEY